MNDDEILSHLRAQAKASEKRQHANFFGWHDRSPSGKGVAESGIVDDLLGAMEAAGLSEYRNLGPSGEEWPDVWLEGPDGKRTPCEVTELVDQHALPSGQARPWTASQLVDQLQAKLRTKGLRSVGGSQGDKSILVIHTDESYLNAENVAAMLADVSFKQPPTIDRVFLLLSYDPNRAGYRFFELQLAV